MAVLTIEPSLQAASGSVAPAGGAPATLGPGDALGALGELGALGGARVSPGEQAATLARLAAQWHKGRTHALQGGEEDRNVWEEWWLTRSAVHTIRKSNLSSTSLIKAHSFK